MPDNRITRLLVSNAWQAVYNEKIKIKEKNPDADEYKLGTARAALRRAIAKWEAPGDTDSAKLDFEKDSFYTKLKKKFGKP